MSTAAEDRLDAVTHDLHLALEARIGDLMGAVRAAETLARQLQSLDDEIDRVSDRYERAQDSADADQALALQGELSQLRETRARQVEDLASLTSQLHG